ncbi:carbonic anhydrase [Lentisphaerota bacterium ZTH]|nr:carbonic anhydrase [Lentisphaerota bacterium]WET05494.1 carbonic anhydrase [Lentisphaerota bacterium ZTH]
MTDSHDIKDSSKQQCSCSDSSVYFSEMAERSAKGVAWQQALQRLKDGNRRYVNKSSHNNSSCEYTRQLLCKGQWPYATVLCCSDSRVSPEIVFDAGLGDLFIVRVAGNIIDSRLLGSIEYATLHSTSKLIVVMGHGSCGAVTAATHAVSNPDVTDTPGINGIVSDLMPAVLKAKKHTGLEGCELIEAAARENVRMSCNLIRETSEPLADMENAGDIKIIGAYKHLTSDEVEFFD